jgi:hypothetical protein
MDQQTKAVLVFAAVGSVAVVAADAASGTWRTFDPVAGEHRIAWSGAAQNAGARALLLAAVFYVVSKAVL